MKHRLNIKIIFSLVTLVWIALIAATIVSRTVVAQPQSHTLEPPFTFVPVTNKPDIGFPPPGNTVIMTETFGASFSPIPSLIGSTPAWRVVANPDDTARYYWGRVATGTFSNTAWSATTPITSSPPLTPGTSTYPAKQDTWLLYGPIDLSKFISAQLNFEYYLDSEPGDTLIWAVSYDGQTFYGSSQGGGHGSAWLTGTLVLDRSGFVGNQVYIAFAFQSHAAPIGLGAFIRNVRLTGEPYQYVYAPLVVMNYPPTSTPTPTPTPYYGYTFDDNGASLAHWGGAFYGTDSNDGKKYGQCVPGQCTIHTTYPHGNPGDSLRLYSNGLYKFKASSPNDILPNSYDLYVDISPWVIYPRDASCALYGCPSNDLGDWYGIIFNASSNTFGTDMSQFAYNKIYYRVYFYNVDSIKPIAIKLERCDGGSNPGDNSCHNLGTSSMPSNFIGNAGGFDTVHIVRLAGGTIQVWVNGNLLITANDSNYTGSSYGKYGIFIFSWDNNATQNPPVGYEMQVDFDNIRVYER